MDDMTKPYGMALYLEFRRNENTSQIIITSESVDPETKKVVPATVIQRNTTPAFDRKSWKIKVLDKPTGRDIDPSTGRLATNKNLAFATDVARRNLVNVHQYLDGYRLNNWQMHGIPLFVEMAVDEVHMVAASSTPEGLIRRIKRARLEAGFDASMWDTGI